MLKCRIEFCTHYEARLIGICAGTGGQDENLVVQPNIRSILVVGQCLHIGDFIKKILIVGVCDDVCRLNGVISHRENLPARLMPADSEIHIAVFFCKVYVSEVFQNAEFHMQAVAVTVSEDDSHTVQIIYAAHVPFRGNIICTPDTFSVPFVMGQIEVIIGRMLQNRLFGDVR